MNEHLDPSAAHFSSEDLEAERQLRPKSFADFCGQDQVVGNLSVFVLAANRRGDALDHVLLHGPPGLGKTTLAHILANELDVNIKVTAGPVLDKPGDLAGLLTNLEARDVLFIDEIHRLTPVVEEYLYAAMEDFKIDIVLETGPNARTVQIHLNSFTLIGATTRAGLLTAPMRARFGISSRLEYYNRELITQIVQRSARISGVRISVEAAVEIAGRSRGTPRIANALLRRVRDFAEIKGDGYIDVKMAKYALKALHVDDCGLDLMDNKILTTLIDKFDGGPVGIGTLSMAVSENAETLEEVYEPFLIQGGFIVRTPRGRCATKLAYAHLGRTKSSDLGMRFD
ncbi:MAG: Holliday junction branch migration DNA helicase RuvB [Flavobacteriales bacterium]